MWSTHVCGLYVPICIFCLVLTVDKNTAKFKEWLDVGSLVELKPNSDVIEVLGFFAYETVREVRRSVASSCPSSSSPGSGAYLKLGGQKKQLGFQQLP